MTTNFRLLAMAAVAMLAMNSCVKEENLNNGDKKGTPVEFEMGVNSVSRTSTPDNGYATTFVEGDEVGIFVYEGETPVFKNAPYKRNAEGKWVAQGTPITAEEGKSYSYYAYYPYNATATDATSVSLTVAGDQTTGYTGSDALMARSVNVAAGTTTVPLKYSHAFALVQVTLKGDLAAKDATVTLQNVYPTAAINLKDSIIGEAAGTSGTVAMKACSTNGAAAPYNYRAIVPAQTIAANKGILTTFSNGKNYKFTYSVEVPYESGKLRQFDVTLGSATGNKIEIGQGIISDWTDGSVVEGGEGDVEEVIVPVTSLTLPFEDGISFQKLNNWNTTKFTADELTWIHRENNSETELNTPSIVTKDDVPVLKLTLNGTKATWGNSNIGCHYPGLFNKTTYKVSIKAQTDFEEDSVSIKNAVYGIFISSSQDDKIFKMYNNKGEFWSRNVTTFNKLPANSWKESTFYIDFSSAYNTGSSSELTEDKFSETVDNDVNNGINIYLYNYSNTSPVSVYIKEVKIEEAALPEATE
ncbi:fimbrillin family protein [Bacteroides caecigallinarum]|nr:fimbrillin family protein [Bacteroides caecigallinarum]